MKKNEFFDRGGRKNGHEIKEEFFERFLNLHKMRVPESLMNFRRQLQNEPKKFAKYRKPSENVPGRR